MAESTSLILLTESIVVFDLHEKNKKQSNNDTALTNDDTHCLITPDGKCIHQECMIMEQKTLSEG